MKCNFPKTAMLWLSISVCQFVGCSVFRRDGWSVSHNFLKGREVTLLCFYRSTCYFISLWLKGCYCERLITNSQHCNGLKSGKEVDEKMVRENKIFTFTILFFYLNVKLKWILSAFRPFLSFLDKGHPDLILHWCSIYMNVFRKSLDCYRCCS